MSIVEAYAAGIWEGEGSSAAYHGSGPKRRALVFAISVWQSNYLLLNWMQERFSGGVYGRNGAGYGKGSRKKTGEWRVTGHSAYQFLTIIRPYTVFRNAEIDVLIHLWENRDNRETVSKLCEERKRVRTELASGWSPQELIL